MAHFFYVSMPLENEEPEVTLIAEMMGPKGASEWPYDDNIEEVLPPCSLSRQILAFFIDLIWMVLGLPQAMLAVAINMIGSRSLLMQCRIDVMIQVVFNAVVLYILSTDQAKPIGKLSKLDKVADELRSSLSNTSGYGSDLFQYITATMQGLALMTAFFPKIMKHMLILPMFWSVYAIIHMLINIIQKGFILINHAHGSMFFAPFIVTGLTAVLVHIVDMLKIARFYTVLSNQ